jgi:hypothetical protein
MPEYNPFSCSEEVGCNDDQEPTAIAGSDLPLRARAFAAFAMLRLQNFYNVEMAGALDTLKEGMSNGWHLCTTVWNWPLPP